jgi:hypothetical protein
MWLAMVVLLQQGHHSAELTCKGGLYESKIAVQAATVNSFYRRACSLTVEWIIWCSPALVSLWY